MISWERKRMWVQKYSVTLFHTFVLQKISMLTWKTADIHKVTLNRRVTYGLMVGVKHGWEKKKKHVRARKKKKRMIQIL